jgi:hypothetical protein
MPKVEIFLTANCSSTSGCNHLVQSSIILIGNMERPPMGMANFEEVTVLPVVTTNRKRTFLLAAVTEQEGRLGGGLHIITSILY